MDWTLDTRSLLVVILAVAIIILTLILFFWFRRASRRPATDGLEGLLKAYRHRNPYFFRLLTFVREEDLLDSLTARGDVRAALRLLEEKAAESAKQSRKSSLLDLPAPEDAKVQAAVVTVLRAVYFDDEIRKRLPEEGIQDLDRFLDNLTRSGSIG